jgi:hypothetical protein
MKDVYWAPAPNWGLNLFPTGVSQWVGETRNPWVSGPGAKPETRVYLLDSKLLGLA